MKDVGKDAIATLLRDALAAALNCAELVRNLLTFARHQPQKKGMIDLSRPCPADGKAAASRRRRGRKDGYHRHRGRDLAIDADRAQVESALVNLALNARDAMPAGGTLTIAARNVRMGASALEPTVGDYVALEVIDTGTGNAAGRG